MIELNPEQKIDLSEQADRFLKSELFGYIWQHLADGIDKAKEGMVQADPSDAAAMTKYQNRIVALRTVPEILGRIFQEGLEIETNLETLEMMPEE